MVAIEFPEKTDDAMYQEQEAAQQAHDLFTETIERTGMETDAAAKLSIDTLYTILSELDTAEEEYARWAETIAR